MYATTDESGRITAASERREFLDGEPVEIDFPEGFDFAQIGEYVMQDGELVRVESDAEKARKACELKAKLAETDHHVLKALESFFAEGAAPDGIMDTIEQRRAWREAINELEG